MIFLDTQQYFRTYNLTAYVMIASQAIKHFVFHFKLKKIIIVNKIGLFTKNCPNWTLL